MDLPINDRGFPVRYVTNYQRVIAAGPLEVCPEDLLSRIDRITINPDGSIIDIPLQSGSGSKLRHHHF